jgi:hypothetical protein
LAEQFTDMDVLTAAFGARLHAVVLFGSEARGQAAPDSDIDLFVVLDGPHAPFEDLADLGQEPLLVGGFGQQRVAGAHQEGGPLVVELGVDFGALGGGGEAGAGGFDQSCVSRRGSGRGS